MTATPAERSVAAKIANNVRWSRTVDRAAATQPARTAFMARFEAQVDPDGVLPAEQRAVLAQNAMKAHMLRMRLNRMHKKP